VRLTVDLQRATTAPVPTATQFRRWLRAALSGRTPGATAEVAVRLVDREEMAALNENYRARRGPTNVLSFPADLPAELGLPLLGDIVICAPVVRDEAAAQGVDGDAHWAHMAVHGALHLLGYDHIEDSEAAAMERLESAILRDLGYDCPYGEATPEGEGQLP